MNFLLTNNLNNFVTYPWELLHRYASYPSQLEDNVEALKNAVESLNLFKWQILRREAIRMKKSGTLMDPSTDSWCDRVVEWVEKSNELISMGEVEVDRLCLGGLCSMDWFSAIQVSKQLAKFVVRLNELEIHGKKLLYVKDSESELESESGAKGVASMKASRAKVDLEIEEDGLTTLLHQVLHYFQREEVQMIGVWGQGGVGKTTLLQEISEHFACQNGFLVIWIDVPEDLNLEMIQQDIGDKIGLPIALKNKSVAEKAAYISKILKSKKIVLLLDDIRGPIDLSKIGVPDLSETRSKLVFTTRLEQVCTEIKPQPQRSVQAKPLTEEQAWQLFLTHAGEESIHNDPEICPLAQTLAKRYGGLPLALTMVGKLMSGKTDSRDWEHAIMAFEKSTHLQSSDHQDIIEDGQDDMKSELFSIFKYSYDNLPHRAAKPCFLYCALFPEGFPIPKSELLDLWIHEDFGIDCDLIDETDDPRYKARYVLRSLVRASLLEDHGEWVIMPKMFRSMALYIAEQDASVMAGMKLKEAPDVGSWQGMKRVSLMHNYIEELIKVPECPNLLTLFLNKNKELLEICNGFFGFMPKLTVLNLSSTGIEELPVSISCLVSLLHLDISYTKIKELPIVLKELKRLKYFDINGLDIRFNRSNGVICNLSSLQVLKMVCDYCYEEGGGGGEGEIEAEREITMGTLLDDEILLKELQYLEKLTVLQITVRSFSSLQKLITTHKLSRRTQTLCLRHFKAPSVDVSLLENMENIESLFVTRCDFKELYVKSGMYTPTPYTYRCFSSITRVAVINCDYLQHLTCLVLLPNLRILEVSCCMKLGEIISGDRLRGVLGQDRNLEPFSNLAVLELCLLPSLENICSTSLPLRFLYQLRVSDCPRLKKLPLDVYSILGCSIQLIADEGWFDAIEWEDDNTRAAVLSRVNFSPVGTAYTRSFASKQTEMAWPRQR